jgi:DNA-binding beta-propeller fold protein YncE/tetratricopeptide (TPR) repeat protein
MTMRFLLAYFRKLSASAFVLGLMFLGGAGLIGSSIARAQTPPRVEFVRSVITNDLRKLLGMDAQHLYVARKSGQVDALDVETGEVVFTLQAQDAKGKKLLGRAEEVVVAGDTVYVLDGGENRVVLYGLDGKHKGTIGGRGDASLSSPQGLAVAGGIVYVADTGNRRIQMYGDNGVYLSSLGIDRHAANKSLNADKTPYKLEQPTGVAVSPKGQIYVLDAAGGLFSDRSQVKVYAADGRFLRMLPKNGKPAALLMGPDGSAYVTDAADFTIQRYLPTGGQPSYFGSKGDGRGQFMSLAGLAFEADDSGNVYVGDPQRGLLHHFRVPAARAVTPELAELPPVVRVRQSLPLAASRLAWDGKGTLAGVARGKSDVILLHKEGKTSELKLKKGLVPGALGYDKNGTLWMLETKNDKLHQLDAAGNPVLTIGRSGSRNGQFDGPRDFVFASDGSIYVADTGNGRIQGFSPDGVFFRVIDKGVKDKLDEPVALAIDEKDNLYVLDVGRNAVVVYGADGAPVREFGNDPAREDERLQKPVGLMVTQEEVLVLSSGRVSVYGVAGDKAGRLLRTFGTDGKEAGELARAQSITARDANTFFIADGDQARVQVFATGYRPQPPQGVKAAPAVHGVALSWTASPLNYVGGYTVYRAEQEAGPWERIGTSEATAYADTGLQPGVKYHYRVASATRSEAQEGALGTTVAAAALKYTPPPPDEVQVDATPSSLHLHWKFMELVSGYRLYEKEGDKFKLVAESSVAEFRREKLASSTDYSYWLSAVSVDGLESEKRQIQAKTQVDTRPPLEIDATQLANVFSNSYKLYEQDGVGMVKLTNNTTSPLTNVKVSFMLNNFMDFPTEQRLDLLEPGQSAEVPLKAVFNNRILSLTEDTPVQAKLEASYFADGQTKTYSQVRTISIYDKHRMSWDEPGRYAAFITPKDPLIVNFTRSVAAEFGAVKEPTLIAAALFQTLGVLGLTYVQDPTNPYQKTSNNVAIVDYIQYPRETLRRRSGDCDDLVGLYAASLESLGISTRVLLVPGHMLLMLNTGVTAPADGYTMNDMYVAHEGTLWIPVEATLIGKSFNQAWEDGAKTYYKTRGKEGFEVFNIHTAWETFKPASLPEDDWQPQLVRRDEVEKRFPNEMSSVLKISSQTRTRGYLQAIKANPKDGNAHLQVGIILAHMGDTAEARKYFSKAIELNPKDAAALNNMGNLHMLDEQYPQAQKFYADAAQADPQDAEILINLARSYRASRNIEQAKQAYDQAQKIDAAVANKYKALGLELMNTLSAPPAPAASTAPAAAAEPAAAPAVSDPAPAPAVQAPAAEGQPS